MRKINKYPIPKVCHYCGNEVVYTSNSEIYGREYGNGKCYLCRNCMASVGVHNGTDIPLGILASRELSKLKKQSHDLFDVYWKSNQKSRTQCYKQLAIKLGIDVEQCHFGWFDKDMLQKALFILRNGLFI